MERFWFKPKCYGWGISQPLTWEGWLAIAVLLALTACWAYFCGIFETKPASHISGMITLFTGGIVALSVGCCFLVRNKVEGGLKWRWGDKK